MFSLWSFNNKIHIWLEWFMNYFRQLADSAGNVGTEIERMSCYRRPRPGSSSGSCGFTISWYFQQLLHSCFGVKFNISVRCITVPYYYYVSVCHICQMTKTDRLKLKPMSHQSNILAHTCFMGCLSLFRIVWHFVQFAIISNIHSNTVCACLVLSLNERCSVCN